MIDQSIQMSYSRLKCMFDGKNVNIIVENKDSAKCPICVKSPYQFGQYEEYEYKDAYKPMTNAMELGLGDLRSPLVLHLLCL